MTPGVIFLHIPKTAGSSLREVIRRQYRPDEYLLLRPREHRREEYFRYLNGEGPLPPMHPDGQGREYLLRLAELPPERLAQLRMVMGHLWFGVHEGLPGDWSYITILRDPIERVLSMYQQRVLGLRLERGLALTVEEWARSERDLDMDNEQTRRLASHPPGLDGLRTEATPEMFDSAVRNLREHVSVVGSAERFDLSLLAMARTFGWRKLAYLPANVSNGRPRVEDLSEDVLAILRRHNEYDLELHRVGAQLLDEQVERLGIDPRDVARLERRNVLYRRTPAAVRIRRDLAQRGKAGHAALADRQRPGRARGATPRPVIFLHVPKTAGSTLRDLLARQFRRGEVWTPPARRGEAEKRYLAYLQAGDARPGRGRPEEHHRRYRRMLAHLGPAERERIRLLIGHFWYGVHEIIPFPADYVTMLRDPVPRVLSMYAHRTAHHGIDKTLQDYVAEGRDWEIDNGQTRRLAGPAGGEDVRFQAATPELLERAKANLRSVRVVGVTERFDEFLALLVVELGWRTFAYFPRNVSERRPRERDLDDSVLEAIRERNALDLELHRYAGELMEERIAARRREVEARVRSIRRRNGIYRRAHPVALRLRKRARDARARLGRLVRPA